jgi:peroxiredoxin
MSAHLVRWHNEFAKKGLVIIDINNGDIDSLAAVKKHVEKKKLPYPVGWDEGEKTCKTYGVQSYPSQYLIGTDGKVVWEGFCLDDNGKVEKKVEAQVKSELEKVSKEELEK